MDLKSQPRAIQITSQLSSITSYAQLINQSLLPLIKLKGQPEGYRPDIFADGAVWLSCPNQSGFHLPAPFQCYLVAVSADYMLIAQGAGD